MAAAAATFVIYGSYGFMGSLLAKYAVSRGLQPVLSGRNARALAAQAEALQLRAVVASAQAPDALQQLLEEEDAVQLLLNAAGPFHRTFEWVSRLALRAGVHYIDVSEEAQLLPAVAALADTFKASKLLLLPGAGFRSVVADCLGEKVLDALPQADQLSVAIGCDAPLSPGRWASLIDGPLRREERHYSLKEGRKQWVTPQRTDAFGSAAVSFALAECQQLSLRTTAKQCQGFLLLPALLCWMLSLRHNAALRWLLSTAPMLWLLSLLFQSPQPPSTEQRRRARSRVVVRARHSVSGREKTLRLSACDCYSYTALVTIKIVENVLFRLPRRPAGSGAAPRIGWRTASDMFGHSFAETLAGAEVEMG
eukprot:PLAT12433.1.p1 GENE.PLAT12433.1~~PLAT12433.1.p1  ORF type:complete len:366 (-),score=158.44 PLAT12433.1:223-1320(-)